MQLPTLRRHQQGNPNLMKPINTIEHPSIQSSLSKHNHNEFIEIQIWQMYFNLFGLNFSKIIFKNILHTCHTLTHCQAKSQYRCCDLRGKIEEICIHYTKSKTAKMKTKKSLWIFLCAKSIPNSFF